MKKLKGVLKKLIITYLIIYITLSSSTSCFARGYDAQCGEYASQWAIDYVAKYASKSTYSQTTLGSGQEVHMVQVHFMDVVHVLYTGYITTH